MCGWRRWGQVCQVGVTHVLTSSPLKPSPVVWFLAPAGRGSPSPKLGTGADGGGVGVWGRGEGRGQSCCCLLEGLSGQNHGLFWACPCIGSGSCLLCWGLGLCQDKGGPAPWTVERNRSQIKDWADVLLDCTCQCCQTALGRGAGYLLFGRLGGWQ